MIDDIGFTWTKDWPPVLRVEALIAKGDNGRIVVLSWHLPEYPDIERKCVAIEQPTNEEAWALAVIGEDMVWLAECFEWAPVLAGVSLVAFTLADRGDEEEPTFELVKSRRLSIETTEQILRKLEPFEPWPESALSPAPTSEEK